MPSHRPLAVYAIAALSTALGAQAQSSSPVAVDGADEGARDAIKALLPERDAPRTRFDAERLSEEAATRATAWMRAQGYYGGAALAQAEGEPPRARILVTLGPRFALTAPTLTFEGAEPAPDAQAAARAALAAAPEGAPARAQAVLDAEAAAVAALAAAGYADARALERRVVVDHATQRMDAALRVQAGERVRLGRVRAEPEELLRLGFLEDVTNWVPGEAYTPERVSRLRRDVAATGVVSRVTTRLEPRADDPGRRDVVLDLEAAPRHALELGGGYSTTEGVGVEAEWTRRNLTRRDDTLRVIVRAGEKLQQLGADLSRPHAVGLGRTLRFSADARREDTDAFEREGLALAASVDAAQRLRLAASYGVNLAADRFDDASGRSDAVTLSTFAELRRDTTGSLLDARDGDVAVLRIEPSYAAGDAGLGFVRATLEARTYETSRDGAGRTTYAARARLGHVAAITGTDEDIPPDRRFYAGGGGSVRGYAFNSIFPEDRRSAGATPGGQYLIEVSAEARTRMSGAFERWFDDRLGFAAFIDGGAAFDTWDEAADLKWGAGLGARYDLGFAPLRIDVAFPLDPGPDDLAAALYVSIGQAF
jgi:translocation and assembly module TamA